MARGVGGVEAGALRRIEQRRHHADRPRRVEHVHGAAAVVRRDLHRRVLRAGGGAADQQRRGEALPRHLAGDVHHLVERRRDQAAQADDVGVVLPRRGQDLRRRHHDPEVDDLVAVAAEDHADDVLADVVDVALDGGQQHLPRRPRSARLALERHERLEERHGLLHRARALHHLRQEHLAGAEQVADVLHAVHQRPFDDLDRPQPALPRLLDVDLDEVDDAVHQRVRQPRRHRLIAPGVIVRPLRARALDAVGELDQPLGRVGTAVEQHVLDVREQLLGDVLVDGELAGVDDAHVHARLDRVIQEGGVHRLADDVVAAERERQVADAAADVRRRGRWRGSRAPPRCSPSRRWRAPRGRSRSRGCWGRR